MAPKQTKWTSIRLPLWDSYLTKSMQYLPLMIILGDQDETKNNSGRGCLCPLFSAEGSPCLPLCQRVTTFQCNKVAMTTWYVSSAGLAIAVLPH